MKHAAILTKDKILASTTPGDITRMMLEARGNFPPAIMNELNRIASNQISTLVHIAKLESLISDGSN